MKHILRVVVAVTIMLTVASPAAAGSNHSAANDEAYVEHIMYATSMRGFLDEVGSDTWFDWSTDFCSAPLVGNTGRTFNFTNACRRHDFGYRNLHLLDQRYGRGHWTSSSRKRVDQQFLEDMRDHCYGRRWWDEPTCLAWAQTFYSAVRVAGNM
ncbi:MAG TPA: phospholipase A2 [Ilumatobacteraceae bacterium]|jgi:hypothetical protein